MQKDQPKHSILSYFGRNYHRITAEMQILSVKTSEATFTTALLFPSWAKAEARIGLLHSGNIFRDKLLLRIYLMKVS